MKTKKQQQVEMRISSVLKSGAKHRARAADALWSDLRTGGDSQKKNLEREKRKAWERRVQKQLSALLFRGSELANIAFNLKQDARQGADVKRTLHETQEAWDAVKRKLPRWMR